MWLNNDNKRKSNLDTGQRAKLTAGQYGAPVHERETILTSVENNAAFNRLLTEQERFIT